MIKKILLITATLALISSLSILAYAYLKEEKATDNLVYEVGELKVSVSGKLIDTYLIPGVNIVDTDNTFKLTNSGNIKIDVRVKVSYFLDGLPFNDFALAPSEQPGDATDFPNNSFEASIEAANYYNVIGGLAPGASVNILTLLVLDGEIIKGHLSDQTFKIRIDVHAKQFDHASWTDLSGKFVN